MYKLINHIYNQIRKLRNETKIVLLLGVPFLICIFQIWGVFIIGADDTYIATDRFRHESIWNSTWGEAVHQGRYFLVIAWTLSQLPYIFDSIVFLNIIRIVINVSVFFSFFAFARSLFGRNYSWLLATVTISLFNAFGGEFNSFHGTPLWYSLGNLFLMLSLFTFTRSCRKESNRDYHPFILFFCSIQFYEVMLFYAAAFPLIYIFFHPIRLTTELKKYSYDALKKLTPLFVAIFLYLTLYIGFRYFFPSNYEGSKTFNFISLERTWKTISQFSLSGIYLGALKINNKAFLLTSITSSFFTLLSLIFILKNTPRIRSLNIKSIQTFLARSFAILFFVFCPNFLYGFIDKYHTWSDALPYYNGSYLSSFALLLFISYLLYSAWCFLVRPITKVIFSVIIGAFIFVGTCSNLLNSLQIMDYQKSKANRWPLMDQFFLENKLKVKEDDTFCTYRFFHNKDSFGIYDYWSIYLSNKYQKKINFLYTLDIKKSCNWYFDITFHKYSTEMIARDLSNNHEYKYVVPQTSFFKL